MIVLKSTVNAKPLESSRHEEVLFYKKNKNENELENCSFEMKNLNRCDRMDFSNEKWKQHKRIHARMHHSVSLPFDIIFMTLPKNRSKHRTLCRKPHTNRTLMLFYAFKMLAFSIFHFQQQQQNRLDARKCELTKNVCKHTRFSFYFTFVENIFLPSQTLFLFEIRSPWRTM